MLSGIFTVCLGRSPDVSSARENNYSEEIKIKQQSRVHLDVFIKHKRTLIHLLD